MTPKNEKIIRTYIYCDHCNFKTTAEIPLGRASVPLGSLRSPNTPPNIKSIIIHHVNTSEIKFKNNVAFIGHRSYTVKNEQGKEIGKIQTNSQQAYFEKKRL